MLYNCVMFTAIILSAGKSQRFGSPKALATINNTTAIEFIQHKLLNSIIDEVIIVLGHRPEVISPYVMKHAKVKVVTNNVYLSGQLSTIQCGLSSCHKDSTAALIWPVDCPLISADTLLRLISVHQQNGLSCIIPSYQGVKGHPPLIPASLYKKISNSLSDIGLNAILKQHEAMTIEINDPGIIKSFNTPKEFQDLNN